MQANQNQWYVKWFTWNCRVLDRFWQLDRSREFKYERGTNLCHFFQTLMWGTIVQVLSVAIWAYVIFTVFVLPWMLFSVSGVLWTVLSFLTVIAAIVAVVAGTVGALQSKEWIHRKWETFSEVKSDQPPKFYQVMWQYVVSVKQKFCPTIQFRKED